MLIRVAFVPDSQRQQRQKMHEIVVNENRERSCVWRIRTAPPDQKVQDVERDRVPVDLVGFAIPVVQYVKIVLTGGAVAGANDSAQIDLPAACIPDVRAHAVAQPQRRAAKVGRSRHVGHDLLAGAASKKGLYRRARARKADVPRSATWHHVDSVDSQDRWMTPRV